MEAINREMRRYGYRNPIWFHAEKIITVLTEAQADGWPARSASVATSALLGREAPRDSDLRKSEPRRGAKSPQPALDRSRSRVTNLVSGIDLDADDLDVHSSLLQQLHGLRECDL